MRSGGTGRQRRCAPEPASDFPPYLTSLICWHIPARLPITLTFPHRTLLSKSEAGEGSGEAGQGLGWVTWLSTYQSVPLARDHRQLVLIIRCCCSN